MENRKLNLGLLIVIAILGLLTGVGLVIATTSIQLSILPEQALGTNILYKIEAAWDLLSLILTLIYLIKGYSKDYAKYYKMAMFLHAINALLVTILSINELTNYISVVFCAICFGLILTLAISKNLGKKTSIIICIIVLTIRCLGLISSMMNHPILSIESLLVVSQIVLALISTVATIAKYDDKQARGTN